MSEMVPWIAAAGEIHSPQRTQRDAETSKGSPIEQETALQNLPAHSFPRSRAQNASTDGAGLGKPSGAKAGFSQESCGTAKAVPFRRHSTAETRVEQPGYEGVANSPFWQSRRDPGHPQIESWEYERERRIYRGRTVAMLRRYMRYSLETGRLPSLVGREFFRSNVTKYRVTTFEDRVIFVHDMERCLGRLDEFAREVLARVVLQEYEHEEAARMFGCTRMTVHRKLIEALDQLSEILLEMELLDSLSPVTERSCQGGKEDDFRLSDCDAEK